MADRDNTIDFALNEAEKFLLKASKFLNKEHGEGFSLKNPDLVIEVAKLYALNFQTTAFLENRGGRK